MTHDIKELLELAARAAGYDLDWCAETGRPAIRDQHGGADYWDPTADDGDCARLEASLDLHIEWWITCVTATRYDVGRKTSACELYGDDRQAARRLASTRAAAEVGRQMK